MKIVHPYQSYWEPLAELPSFVLRPMFGGRAVYVGGKLVLYFSASEEPWRGVLVCTERTHHGALQAEFPLLGPHPILPKWLYLSEAHDVFDAVVGRLVDAVRRGDPRFGVEPSQKKKKARRLKARPRP